VAFGVNLALAGLGAALTYRVARDAGLNDFAQRIALLGYAVWLPGIWNCTLLARENLSTPLLLLVVWLGLRISRAMQPATGLSALSGAALGAAVLAGTSALPLVLAPVVALAWQFTHSHRVQTLRRLGLHATALALGTALVLAPWALATRAMLGTPLITTNTGFNLYIGNNPAATGRFVSIADTPMGPHWRQTRAQLGEVATSDLLATQALDWIGANPHQALALTVRKLGLFWWPNVPDSNDFALSPTVTILRLGEVVQYMLFITLGFGALATGPLPRRARMVLGAALLGTWALHGTAYIIERYRDPVMPIMIVLGAAALAHIITTTLARKEKALAA